MLRASAACRTHALLRAARCVWRQQATRPALCAAMAAAAAATTDAAAAGEDLPALKNAVRRDIIRSLKALSAEDMAAQSEQRPHSSAWVGKRGARNAPTERSGRRPRQLPPAAAHAALPSLNRPRGAAPAPPPPPPHPRRQARRSRRASPRRARSVPHLLSASTSTAPSCGKWTPCWCSRPRSAKVRGFAPAGAAGRALRREPGAACP